MQNQFDYTITESEREKASNAYLMSLVVIIVGLPLPIINLIATFIFYMANRKSTYFVRWHCTQALFSQLSLFIPNTILLWWTIYSIFLSFGNITNQYIAYLLVIMLLNLIEFIATVQSAIQTRKGFHKVWWLIGTLTNAVCKP